MRTNWFFLLGFVTILGSGCASFAPYNPVDKKLGFQEDFEGECGGCWSCRWIADGNASEISQNHIDDVTFARDRGNTLVLHGSDPGWSPLAHVKTHVTGPCRVLFDVYVDTGTPDATVVVGFRTQPSWQQPGILLLSAPIEAPVRVLEPVVYPGDVMPGQSARELCMKAGRWNRVDLQFRPERRRTKLVATLSDNITTRGPIEFVTEDVVPKDMPYFQLEVREGRAWFDNISITPLDWKR